MEEFRDAIWITGPRLKPRSCAKPGLWRGAPVSWSRSTACSMLASTDRNPAVAISLASLVPETIFSFASRARRCSSSVQTEANWKRGSFTKSADPNLLRSSRTRRPRSDSRSLIVLRVQAGRGANPFHVFVVIHAHHQAAAHADDRKHRDQFLQPQIHD